MLRKGKIPQALLRSLLCRISQPQPSVLIGPKVGEDAFAASLTERIIVASTDPITFTAKEIGFYAVNINANDVATMGAQPKWFLATLLLPQSTKQSQIKSIFDDIDRTCRSLGVSLCGGHTEIIPSIDTPIVVGTMIGTVKSRKLVVAEKARPGDMVLLTKKLAIEGTAIIANEKPRVVRRILGNDGLKRARGFLHDPGISVVKEARLAIAAASVSAMHDPTEGGLIWGVREVAASSGKGIEVDLDKVPIYDETIKICNYFKINPYGLIASGSLLIVASPVNAKRIARSIGNVGIKCTEIGIVKSRGTTFRKDGKIVRGLRLEMDEICRVL